MRQTEGKKSGVYPQLWSPLSNSLNHFGRIVALNTRQYLEIGLTGQQLEREPVRLMFFVILALSFKWISHL
ncbi:hypothetical protein SAMN05216377_10950 [Pseudonocardia oroxyli]|uniref:Uncharacterized protein n=1 Tax=Pseudonocardia oroxyli TaxID=366584 RepID=A0A1G7RK10_PSEOR|nr:hypothetical protein SAMN05216377_10950 [Pseudonocardia oroxyli]